MIFFLKKGGSKDSRRVGAWGDTMGQGHGTYKMGFKSSLIIFMKVLKPGPQQISKFCIQINEGSHDVICTSVYYSPDFYGK